MPILSIKNLKKIYHDIDGEVCAIGDINLDIYDKELVSIVGPSGCGKTSLLSILSNLENKSNGLSLLIKRILSLVICYKKMPCFHGKPF